MDPVSKSFIHGSEALSPIRSPSNTSFPVIAIAIVGILATGFLLVSYYIFVIKCCLNWHRIDLLRRFSFSRNRRRHEDSLMAAHSLAAMETRGLDESVIRLIPIFQFNKNGRYLGEEEEEGSFCECAVCLNEFQENEKLRMIPNCGHFFHIDCIDVWLQSNANCPLCRTSISSSTTRRFPFDNQIIAPSSTPQEDPNPCAENVIINGDEDFVVIELGGNNNNNNHHSADWRLLATQEILNFAEFPGRPISPLPRKFESRMVHKKGSKLQKVTSMGDECIDIRGKDEQFAIEPIRRSFSMDSSADPKIYLAIQEAVQQKRQVIEASPIEGSSSRSNKRSFFTFGQGSRGSRNAVSPVYLEP